MDERLRDMGPLGERLADMFAKVSFTKPTRKKKQ